jgi:hypothetical protein
MFKRPSSAELPKTDDLSGDHWNRNPQFRITKETNQHFRKQLYLTNCRRMQEDSLIPEHREQQLCDLQIYR